MKRGTKLYLVNSDGETVGPFPWTLVRECRALDLVALDAWVYVVGGEVWQGLFELPELLTLPKSLSSPESSIGHYKATDRFRKPSIPEQHDYLSLLSCPFATASLDFHLLSWLTMQFVELFPERQNLALEQIIFDEGQNPNFWHTDPATEKQIACLEGRRIFLNLGATKGEAAALIDPASAAQRRRLTFYGTQLPQYLAKQFATELIELTSESTLKPRSNTSSGSGIMASERRYGNIRTAPQCKLVKTSSCNSILLI